MMSDTVNSDAIRREIVEVLSGTTLKPIVDDISAYVGSGKMLRGKLPLYIGKSLSTGVAEKIGAAIEMVHAASLLHDDVIDNSELRRGMPSFWAAKGTQGAILFGDMLICKAFKVLSDTMPERISELIDLTSSVCEAEVEQELITKGNEISYEQSMKIAREKTGALFAFVASCCGGDDQELSEALKETGYQLGTAYQLADDVLDEYGSEEITDKPVGNDRNTGKSTLANMDLEVDVVAEIESLYNAYQGLLAQWPDVCSAWKSYLDNEFKPVTDKFLKNYITR